MDVLERIKDKQDIKAMNKRLIENAISLYADKTHFIYELLQNAEDAGATRVCFSQFADRFEILHDGIPFTESNLQSLCDAANSDKKNQNDKIGKFGIGFKSVFAICNTVRLYSEPFNRNSEGSLERIAVKIDNYIDPSYIKEDWNIPDLYTTKFVFPYDVSLYGKPVEKLAADVAQKLRNLGADVLLFMKNIEQIEYTIEGIGKEFDVSSIYMLDRQSIGDRISKVSTLGETNKIESGNDCSYLIFSKKIDETDRSVDIAFSAKEEDGKMFFDKSISPYVSMYFPTETESKLNFIVQAPFDLTPNRSSLEKDSDYNIKLIKLLTELFVEALLEIKDRKWLSLEFINLLPYDSSNPVYAPNWHFYAFHTKVLKMIMREEIIPAIDGSYVKIENAKIQRSAKLLDLFEGELLCRLLNNPNAKWLPKDFTANSPLKNLHGFLKELGAEEISPIDDLARLIKANPAFLQSVDDDWLESFYNFLTNDVTTLLGKNGNLATIAFVKTSDECFNAPFVSRRSGRTVEKEPNIYIRPENASYSIKGFLFVDEFIEQNCVEFLNALGLPEPEPFDYFIRELEVSKTEEKIDEEVNLAQVKKAIQYLKSGPEKANEVFSDLLWVKVTDTKGKPWFVMSQSDIYRENDYNGISLKDYFCEVDCKAYILDEQFYLDGGVSDSDLKVLEQIGVKNHIYEGLDKTYWRDGNADCFNKGDFRKQLNFDCIYQILQAISKDHYKNEFIRARCKSSVVIMLLKNVEKHLQGQWQYRSTNPEYNNGVSRIIEILCDKTWVLVSNGEIMKTADISRYDLDTKVYGEVDEKSEIYELLGFKKTDQDKREELVKEFFSRYRPEQIDSIIKSVIPEEAEDIFDPEVDDDYISFPEQSIKDLQRLKGFIKQKYFKAPKVTYERVLRRIRTSRGNDKDHIRYRYKGYCQICENPSHYWEVVEIFNNPNKELEEMNLSLCPSCATEYRRLRNNDTLMQRFAQNIIEANIAADPCVELGERYIRFTKAHLAEIQEILNLEKTNKE